MVTKKAVSRKETPQKKSIKKKKWSGYVTKNSNALDLERDVFKKKDPKKIAASLKRSAEHSKRRKGGPYQSAMSMLNFYINRAGEKINEKRTTAVGKGKD